MYALEWEEDEYRLYVDDQLYFTFKNEGTGYEVWPYDKRFHILLNLAIGGNWEAKRVLMILFFHMCSRLIM